MLTLNVLFIVKQQKNHIIQKAKKGEWKTGNQLSTRVLQSCTEIFKIFAGNYREQTPFFSNVLRSADLTINPP